MLDEPERSSPRRRGRRRGRRRRAREDFDAGRTAEVEDALLSEDPRHLREARRRAHQKVELSRKALRAALITVPLLVFIPFAGAIALVFFGVDLGRRAFGLFYEPRLRERFLQEEIQRRVHRSVRLERRHLEGEQRRSLEQLSASIAHEIRNPITAVKSLVQQMGEEPAQDDRGEYARVALGELERVERSITHLLRFAREEERRVERLRLEDVVVSALETFRERFGRSGIAVERRFDVPGEIDGDPEQLRRVVINLVTNAIDVLEEARVDSPAIEVSIGENLAGTEVWLRVADNGPGIDERDRDRIFDPFVTSRTQGTGLGLSLVRKLVDEHGGQVEVESPAAAGGEGAERRGGSAFLVTLPRAGTR